MFYNPRNRRIQVRCPGCGLWGVKPQWDKGVLVVACRDCAVTFEFAPRTDRAGWGTWRRRSGHPPGSREESQHVHHD